jgi:hypothetical protein
MFSPILVLYLSSTHREVEDTAKCNQRVVNLSHLPVVVSSVAWRTLCSSNVTTSSAVCRGDQHTQCGQCRPVVSACAPPHIPPHFVVRLSLSLCNSDLCLSCTHSLFLRTHDTSWQHTPSITLSIELMEGVNILLVCVCGGGCVHVGSANERGR